MPVLLSSQYPQRSPVSLGWLQQVAENLLTITGRDEAELSLLLVDDARIQEMNRHYRGKDKPTNVLSFPQIGGDDPTHGYLLGDIVISLDTAIREAAGKGITTHSHCRTLLIHGLVHLLGLDHERSEEEYRLMLAQEEFLAKELKHTERRNRMINLAINVDHVATLRQARGGKEPDPVTAAGICELAGAGGIVVHLREDRRHIQDRDVYLLRELVKTKLNLEMGANEEIIRIALQVKPNLITLVPEKRQELTTEGGLDVAGQRAKLKKVVARMEKAGIPVSMFIDPDPKQVAAAREVGATFVEIHTGRYADAASEEIADREFELIASAAESAYETDLRINAGHGLNYLNTPRIAELGMIEELSIGHAVMARAVFVGLDQAVREMLALL